MPIKQEISLTRPLSIVDSTSLNKFAYQLSDKPYGITNNHQKKWQEKKRLMQIDEIIFSMVIDKIDLKTIQLISLDF